MAETQRPPGFVPYPTWRYHRDGRAVVVKNQEEEDALEGDWSETPPGVFESNKDAAAHAARHSAEQGTAPAGVPTTTFPGMETMVHDPDAAQPLQHAPVTPPPNFRVKSENDELLDVEMGRTGARARPRPSGESLEQALVREQREQEQEQEQGPGQRGRQPAPRGQQTPTPREQQEQQEREQRERQAQQDKERQEREQREREEAERTRQALTADKPDDPGAQPKRGPRTN